MHLITHTRTHTHTHTHPLSLSLSLSLSSLRQCEEYSHYKVRLMQCVVVLWHVVGLGIPVELVHLLVLYNQFTIDYQCHWSDQDHCHDGHWVLYIRRCDFIEFDDFWLIYQVSTPSESQFRSHQCSLLCVCVCVYLIIRVPTNRSCVW
jgi:hypothetical protein